MQAPIESWQKILAQGFSHASELLAFLNLPVAMGNHQAEQSFRTRVPKGFAARMEKGNPRDPLLLQVLATEKEMIWEPNFIDDPLNESKVNTIPGLIHKYHGRVLLTLTGSCAINCRFCFRRHFPYEANNPGRQGWQEALDYIKNDTNIEEIILSGGDPLLARDELLEEILGRISSIAHVKTVRFHTRIPVVLPERITPELLNCFRKSPLKIVIVLHSNHPNELVKCVAEVCQKMVQVGCTLLNQSVLLAGINDTSNCLVRLSKRLFEISVMPYYLHLLDKVAGAAHFDLPLARALQIFHEMQTQLPGYLVPRLVREVAGVKSKTLIV